MPWKWQVIASSWPSEEASAMSSCLAQLEVHPLNPKSLKVQPESRAQTLGCFNVTRASVIHISPSCWIYLNIFSPCRWTWGDGWCFMSFREAWDDAGSRKPPRPAIYSVPDRWGRRLASGTPEKGTISKKCGVQKIRNGGIHQSKWWLNRIDDYWCTWVEGSL